MVIKSVEIDDNGIYFCRAQNSEGFGHDSIPIYVETKGEILVYWLTESIFMKNQF